MALDLIALLPVGWRTAMMPFLDRDVVARLNTFVEREYEQHTVFPPLPDLYSAFHLCPPEHARVLILGQDPYHKAGQAHGLSFSVRFPTPPPPSLRNIYKELQEDLGVAPPPTGDLTGWAAEGVLMLNAVLTVRQGAAASHAGHGWEHLTDAAIRALDARPERVVFLLWGRYAHQKAPLVTADRHVVLKAGHPSPMNPRGFLGSRPFSACNKALVDASRRPINWSASPATTPGIPT